MLCCATMCLFWFSYYTIVICSLSLPSCRPFECFVDISMKGTFLHLCILPFFLLISFACSLFVSLTCLMSRVRAASCRRCHGSPGGCAVSALPVATAAATCHARVLLCREGEGGCAEWWRVGGEEGVVYVLGGGGGRAMDVLARCHARVPCSRRHISTRGSKPKRQTCKLTPS